MKQNDLDLIERADQLISRNATLAQPGSRLELLYILLAGAAAASHRGDYGISAVAVVRFVDHELLSFASNTVFSSTDPRGHAEANAVSQLLAVGAEGRTASDDAVQDWPGLGSLHGDGNQVFVRSRTAPGDLDESILFTSLEPCPMCAVVTLNAGINSVVVGNADPWAGAMSGEGVHHLPRLWRDLADAQGLRVQFLPQLRVSEAEAEVLQLLDLLFRSSKEVLDRMVGGGGLLQNEDVVRRLTSAVASGRRVSI